MDRELAAPFPDVLAGAHRGQAWAFDWLFRWLGRPVGGYLRNGGAEDPDGLANEVFLRAFRRIGTFAGDERSFRSWVFTIAHNALCDDRRRRSRSCVTVPLERAGDARSAPGADVAALGNLGDERALELLAALSDGQRDVLLLRVVADLSLEETAAATGLTVGAVKALQHRALATLRRTMPLEAVSP